MGENIAEEELRAELERLRTENARLRSLLNLDDREADGHATAWSPMLIPDPTASPRVDRSSSNQEKLVLMASLFGARSDLYAVRWENEGTRKKGWSPATRHAPRRDRRAPLE